ncbi:MAG: 1-deoxy-D-xylulose-5-phosphate synthase [Candidatus Azotimanducaceae bacterium]|jgi:1-deoxy-D-xylulose-5-phosphate synthase
MFTEIPLQRPTTPLLDSIADPAALRRLTSEQLPQLAEELRHFLLYTVGQTGGHFGAGLGVIELTIALHYVFETPRDQLVWDVGHQTYPHKILTGRRELMGSLRQRGGVAPFPSRDESPYDTFGVGHSSTSISAALGMAIAARIAERSQRTVAIIGDGAMTAGMAFEALNHAADTGADMLVILNDNAMSISKNVGGLAKYFARILSSRLYLSMREGSKKLLSRIPHAWELAKRTEEHMKGMVVPGTLFDELGLNYMGPIDGHDLETLVSTLENIKDLKGPQFLHIITQKGKGYGPAEASPVGTHSLSKIEAAQRDESVEQDEKALSNRPSYSNVFGRWLVDMADQEPRLVGITPAMREGSDMIAFSEKHPGRYFDVAIAEQHAVTLAAGFACQGAMPVVAIYSTFLQRAYDQLIHDVAIQNLNVLFAIDRAGLLEDGPTHSGAFDLSFLRCVPNLVIMAPSDENEARQMLYTGFMYPGPAAVRYPRGKGPGVEVQEQMSALPVGKAVVRREGQLVAILAFGVTLAAALQAADELNATVVDMRFVKPLDEALLRTLASTHALLVSIEENSLVGGAGSAINEFLAAENLPVNILNLGIPDRFIGQEKPTSMLKECGLDAVGVHASISQRLQSMELNLARKSGYQQTV